MSQAPNLQVLLNFGYNIEQAAKKMVLASGINQCLTPTSKDKRFNSTTQVRAVMSQAVEQGLTAGGKEEWSVFDVVVAFDVETDRTEDKNMSANELGSRHNDWATKIKALMLRGNMSAWTTVGELNYYRVIQITPLGESPIEYNTEDDVDVSHQEYMLRIQIRPNAWPTGY